MVLRSVADLTSRFDPLLHRLREYLGTLSTDDHGSDHKWVVPSHGSIHPHLKAFIQLRDGFLSWTAVQVQRGYAGLILVWRCKHGQLGRLVQILHLADHDYEMGPPRLAADARSEQRIVVNRFFFRALSAAHILRLGRLVFMISDNVILILQQFWTEKKPSQHDLWSM